MRENNLSLKNPIIDVANLTIADSLIDTVRCWIGEVGEKTTKFFAIVEHPLGQLSNARSGVASISPARRRVD
jgi:hypothetical protein